MPPSPRSGRPRSRAPSPTKHASASSFLWNGEPGGCGIAGQREAALREAALTASRYRAFLAQQQQRQQQQENVDGAQQEREPLRRAPGLSSAPTTPGRACISREASPARKKAAVLGGVETRDLLQGLCSPKRRPRSSSPATGRHPLGFGWHSMDFHSLEAAGAPHSCSPQHPPHQQSLPPGGLEATTAAGTAPPLRDPPAIESLDFSREEAIFLDSIYDNAAYIDTDLPRVRLPQASAAAASGSDPEASISLLCDNPVFRPITHSLCTAASVPPAGTRTSTGPPLKHRVRGMDEGRPATPPGAALRQAKQGLRANQRDGAFVSLPSEAHDGRHSSPLEPPDSDTSEEHSIKNWTCRHSPLVSVSVPGQPFPSASPRPGHQHSLSLSESTVLASASILSSSGDESAVFHGRQRSRVLRRIMHGGKEDQAWDLEPMLGAGCKGVASPLERQQLPHDQAAAVLEPAPPSRGLAHPELPGATGSGGAISVHANSSGGTHSLCVAADPTTRLHGARAAPLSPQVVVEEEGSDPVRNFGRASGHCLEARRPLEHAEGAVMGPKQESGLPGFQLLRSNGPGWLLSATQVPISCPSAQTTRPAELLAASPSRAAAVQAAAWCFCTQSTISSSSDSDLDGDSDSDLCGASTDSPDAYVLQLPPVKAAAARLPKEACGPPETACSGGRAGPSSEAAVLSPAVWEMVRNSVWLWRRVAATQTRRDAMLIRGFEEEQGLRWLRSSMLAWAGEARLAQDILAAADVHRRGQILNLALGTWQALASETAARLRGACKALGETTLRRALTAWRSLPLLLAAERIREIRLLELAVRGLGVSVVSSRQTEQRAAAWHHVSLLRSSFRPWRDLAALRACKSALREAALAGLLVRKRCQGLSTALGSWRQTVSLLQMQQRVGQRLLSRCRARSDLRQWACGTRLSAAEHAIALSVAFRFLSRALKAWVHFWAREMACRVMAAHCRISAAARCLHAWRHLVVHCHREAVLQAAQERLLARAWRALAAGVAEKQLRRASVAMACCWAQAALLRRAWSAMTVHAAQRQRKASMLPEVHRRAKAAILRRAVSAWIQWSLWQWRKQSGRQMAAASGAQQRSFRRWREGAEGQRAERRAAQAAEESRCQEVLHTWRQHAAQSVQVAVFHLCRLVELGCAVLLEWSRASRAAAKRRRCLAAETFAQWRALAACNASLEERLIIFLTESYERCMANAFLALRDAKATRLAGARQAAAVALQMGLEGCLARCFGRWADHSQALAAIKADTMEVLLEYTVEAVQQRSLRKGGWFQGSPDGRRCSAVLRLWCENSQAAASARRQALTLASEKEAALARAVFFEWCSVIERSVAVLYMQHHRKARMQEELLYAVREQEAAQHAADLFLCRSVLHHWHALQRAKILAALGHMKCMTIRGAFLAWRGTAEAHRLIRASEASLSDLRTQVAAYNSELLYGLSPSQHCSPYSCNTQARPALPSGYTPASGVVSCKEAAESPANTSPASSPITPRGRSSAANLLLHVHQREARPTKLGQSLRQRRYSALLAQQDDAGGMPPPVHILSSRSLEGLVRIGVDEELPGSGALPGLHRRVGLPHKPMTHLAASQPPHSHEDYPGDSGRQISLSLGCPVIRASEQRPKAAHQWRGAAALPFDDGDFVHGCDPTIPAASDASLSSAATTCTEPSESAIVDEFTMSSEDQDLCSSDL
mmetsp:Transcript_11963/g.33671  ORF Transcript_11963/g.33671 Transcript_11963/m.33671 type:complete len:1694 (-) Transcript_11963:278-5359(-)